MKDQRKPYFRTRVESDRVRSYWTGVAPDDPSEHWFFETVEDRGETVAIRQIAVRDDHSLGYSADHLEDEHGFLADQALQPDSDGLEVSDAATFEAAWSSRTNW